MESDRLNRWLTFGANVGVLIGIILLIVELGQNREMMRAQTRHNMAMGLVSLQLSLAENEQLADIMRRGAAGEELSPTEELRILSRTIAQLRYWEDVHYQYRLGLYDESEFSKQREIWRIAFSRNSYRQEYWCRRNEVFSEEFRAEIDSFVPANRC